MRVQSDRAVRNVRYERRARSGRKGATVDAEPRDYQDVIDQALQLVYSHHLRFVSQLYPDRTACQELELFQLRQGQLGQDLHRLSMLARGQTREPKERVLTAIDSVVQLLFWPVAAEDYTVP